MIARITPPITPKNIASTVQSSVPLMKPPITTFWFIAWKTKGQLNAGLKITMWRNISASTAITAMATYRPGCRTGVAWMMPGRSSVCSAPRLSTAVTSRPSRYNRALSWLDFERVDSAALGAPRLQHLFVAAVRLHLLQCLGHRLGELPLVLGQHHAVRCRVVDVAERLELAARLLDRVRRNRGIGEHGIRLSRDDRRGGLILAVVRQDLDRVGTTLLLPGGQVVLLLDRVVLDGDRLAARIVRIDTARIALRRGPLGAGGEVAGHDDLLEALVVDGERGHPHVVLSARRARDDRGELAALSELVRRIAGVGPDHDLAGIADLLGQLRVELGVGADRGGRGRRGVAAAERVGSTRAEHQRGDGGGRER